MNNIYIKQSKKKKKSKENPKRTLQNMVFREIKQNF